MRRSLPEIQESISELEKLMKTTKKARLRERIHMLYLIKSEQAKTRQIVARVLSVNRATIKRWLNTYEMEGISGLLTIKTKPNRKPSIPPDILRQMKQKLRDPEGFKSYKDIQLWIQKEFSLSLTYRAVYNTVRNRLKAKLKVGRKSHIKKRARDYGLQSQLQPDSQRYCIFITFI